MPKFFNSKLLHCNIVAILLQYYCSNALQYYCNHIHCNTLQYELLLIHRNIFPAGATPLEITTHLLEKQDRRIRLTPMVLVGPCDATFHRPIKIKIPHCLPYRNNSWHLRMLARAQNSKSEDWLDLPNSSGIVIPASNKKRKFFKESTYQVRNMALQVCS